MVSTTRRALFAATASAAIIPPATAMTAAPSLAHQLARARAFRAAINAGTYVDDDAFDADAARHTAMEDAILGAPIRSPSDAAAKLRCAFDNITAGGMRSGADKRAVAEVAAWLEAL